MAASTRKNKKGRNKTSKKTASMIEPVSIWGKNKPLEKFWRGLAGSKYVVVIYKNGKHKYVNLPKNPTILFNEFDANSDVAAVLSSNPSQDAYEVYLYPKAKDSSVDYVIKHYKKFFKSMGAPAKDRGEGTPLMKKVLVPL
jgi:hypothetical protein